MKQLQRSMLFAAVALAGCGGGDAPGDAPAPAALQTPFSADAAPQPPQVANYWRPTGDGMMEWAESAYPQFFPAGPQNRFLSPYTYRLYPQTGNYLAVAGDSLYIHGPVAGGVLTRVGSFTSFMCQVDPNACTLAATPAPAPVPAPASATLVPASTLAGVTAVLTAPSIVRAEIVQGQKMNNVSMSGTALGNVTALAGRTLYIIIEDPHSLFEVRPSVSQSSTHVTIFATGKTLPTAGLLAGNLKIYACLDPQCSTALAGSPLLLPYSVTVTPGVSADTESVSVFPGFGEVPAARSIRVNLPPGTTFWSASLLGGGGSPRVISVRSNSQRSNIVGNVSVSFNLAAAGTYRDTVRIAGSQVSASGSSVSFSKDIPVTYTVNPHDAVDAAISPVETVVPMKFGDAQASPSQTRTVVANTGVTLRQLGVEYLSAPAAAAGHARVNSWWSDASATASTCAGTSCLPAGTYQARVRYAKTKAGVSSDVFHAVTLQIYP